MKKEFNGEVRPWGGFEIIEEGKNFCVKRLWVNEGGVLSLQKHFHREEVWVVVSGEGDVLLGARIKEIKHFVLPIGAFIHIPKLYIHRLSNKNKELLEIIEIQTGSILSEMDIERIEDIYGRVTW